MCWCVQVCCTGSLGTMLLKNTMQAMCLCQASPAETFPQLLGLSMVRLCMFGPNIMSLSDARTSTQFFHRSRHMGTVVSNRIDITTATHFRSKHAVVTRRPYIHKLWYNPDTKQVRVQVLSVFAARRYVCGLALLLLVQTVVWRCKVLPAMPGIADCAYLGACRQLTFHLDDIQPADSISPLQTFQANGRTLFIDEASFNNKELLSLLLPPDPMAEELRRASEAAVNDVTDDDQVDRAEGGQGKAPPHKD
jgi:hypothetical protein